MLKNPPLRKAENRYAVCKDDQQLNNETDNNCNWTFNYSRTGFDVLYGWQSETTYVQTAYNRRLDYLGYCNCICEIGLIY